MTDNIFRSDIFSSRVLTSYKISKAIPFFKDLKELRMQNDKQTLQRSKYCNLRGILIYKLLCNLNSDIF